jgi:ubiquinone/menaquinone biosynthesis C-methylase UbiE
MSNSLIHHLRDPDVALAEMCRVTSAGGVIFVRDLLRPASTRQLEQLVGQYAAGETPVQRGLFAASLHAALSLAEVRAIAQRLPLAGSVEQTSDRHWTLRATRPAG